MRLFDTHAHLGLIHEDSIEQFIVAQEARQAGIDAIISISNNLHDFFIIHNNLKTAHHVYHAVGVSPSEVQNPGLNWESQIEKGVALERVVAIGETGLDYYKKFGDKNSQIELFIKQLDLARKFDLPVIIHNREAGSDLLDILRERLPPKGGVLHCYSEDWGFARKALDLNLLFSFAGNVTYRNARNLHETARNIPLERVVVESESPFMVPSDYRGKRNKPSYLHSTVEFLAQLRRLPAEEMASRTFDNACRFFGLTL